MKLIKDWLSIFNHKPNTYQEIKNELGKAPILLPPETGNVSSSSFLSRYLQYLQGSHSYLKFKGLSHGHIPNIALNSVYISLKATIGEGDQEEQAVGLYESDQIEEQIQHSQETVRTQFLDTHFYETAEQIHHKLSTELLLADYPRLVIVGEPGSGKTTLVEYLILELIEKSSYYQEVLSFSQSPMPILLQMRCLQPENLPTLDEFHHACLPEILQPDCPDDFFQNAIKAGCCMLFFDGLDEVTVPEERRLVAKWIDELCAAFPHNRYIVTSRTIGYREAPLHNGFHKFGLCRFDNEDIRQFVFNWQHAVDAQRPHESEADRRIRIRKEADRLLDIMKEKPGIRHLAANPLLLTIVLLVYNSRARLPEERGRLYEECINVLLEHIQKARLDEAREGAFKPTQGLKLEQQRDLLKSMALWLHERGVREAEEHEVQEQVLANRFPAIGLDPSEAQPFLQEVEERSGLIIHRGSGVGFSHLTFQEYLTALELWDREDMQETIAYLVDRRLQSWWHEVIQLYAGITVDAGPLIRMLLDQPDTDLHHVLLLAGQCLADARKVKDLDLRRNVIERLAKLYQETPFRYIRFQARQVLVRVGTPEIAQLFAEILEENSANILAVRDAVEVLSRLHTGTDVKAPLVKLLQQEDLPEEIKQTALRGLQNVTQVDDELIELLFTFMTEQQSIRTYQQAVTTLSALTSHPQVIQRIREDILEHERYAQRLNEIYVAAAKGFIKHIPGPEAVQLLKAKLAIPKAAEYKVEICRALTYCKIPTETLTETLLEILKHGIDWGARGGAALALGLLKHNRDHIVLELAQQLSQETDIGVRLRLAEALGHLGGYNPHIDSILKKALHDEHHFQTRWKLTETYALLTRKEDFIKERIVNPILHSQSAYSIDDKNRFEAFAILCNLEYYTEELIHRVIGLLPLFSQALCKHALSYLAAAPSILQSDRPALHSYLTTVIDDEQADGILRNRAFETLYNIYDLLVGEKSATTV